MFFTLSPISSSSCVSYRVPRVWSFLFHYRRSRGVALWGLYKHLGIRLPVCRLLMPSLCVFSSTCRSKEHFVCVCVWGTSFNSSLAPFSVHGSPLAISGTGSSRGALCVGLCLRELRVGSAGLPGWFKGESKAPKPLPALRVQIQRFKHTYIYLHQRGNRFAF